MLSCFSCIWLLGTSHGQRSLVGCSPWDSPGKNIGVGCQALLQGNLSDRGTELSSLMSPALAGGFFNTSATWEGSTPVLFYIYVKRIYILLMILFHYCKILNIVPCAIQISLLTCFIYSLVFMLIPNSLFILLHLVLVCSLVTTRLFYGRHFQQWVLSESYSTACLAVLTIGL